MCVRGRCHQLSTQQVDLNVFITISSTYTVCVGEGGNIFDTQHEYRGAKHKFKMKLL